jgi:hypothetical protein
MNKILSVTTAFAALCTGLPDPSFADETLTSKSEASVETTVADLERRVERLEAKIGGETIESPFQPRGPKVRHLAAPAQASNQD